MISSTVAMTAFLALGPASATQTTDLPQDFKQLLPRGAIAAIDEPQFVPAKEAKIRDESWVLGVTLNGRARAYSLKLLNSHEVVNDTVGDTPIAAVW